METWQWICIICPHLSISSVNYKKESFVIRQFTFFWLRPSDVGGACVGELNPLFKRQDLKQISLLCLMGNFFFFQPGGPPHWTIVWTTFRNQKWKAEGCDEEGKAGHHFGDDLNCEAAFKVMGLLNLGTSTARRYCVNIPLWVFAYAAGRMSIIDSVLYAAL